MRAKLLVLVMMLACGVHAQIPRTISYQGVLTDTLGVPRPDGTYTFTFRLYDVSSGGSALWLESKTLPVQRGHFVTLLGDQVVIGPSLKFDRRYWLGVQVAAEPELAPRVALATTGYSFSAVRADTSLVAISSVSDTLWRKTADSSIYRLRGRVGIGTTQPDGLLAVNGSDWGNFPMVVRGLPNDNGATLDLDATNSTDGRRYSIMSTGPLATPGAGYFGAYDNAGGWRFVVGPTGNFGIGPVNPTARLEAQVPAEGTLAFRLVSGSNSFLDITPTGSANTVLSTVNNRHLILDTGTGNVGVGTTTPGARIDAVTSGIAGRFRRGTSAATGTFAATHVENFLTTGECAWMRNSSSSNAYPVIKLNRHPSSTGMFVEGINWDGVNASSRAFHITGAGTFVAGSDFAETFTVESGTCEPGDVVVLGGTGGRVIRKCSEPNDPRLVGVYSTRPGILGADKGGETRVDPGDIPVAITGIVPTKVSCENGPVAPGDMLTTSSMRGYAMKATGVLVNGITIYPTGSILGKALRGLEQGEGVIEVLLIQR